MTCAAAELHPLSAYLGAWFARGTPSIAALDAEARSQRIVTGGGMPLRFVAPGGSELGYEERAFRTGEVETRQENRHDLFNALIWLAFPQAKAAMNRRHHEALLAARATGEDRRGSVRDALTQFDECGVIVAGKNGLTEIPPMLANALFSLEIATDTASAPRSGSGRKSSIM